MEPKRNLRALKIKLANLQLEIESLINKGERDPSIIDAISNDINDFTDEVVKIKKEIENITKRKTMKESTKLSEIYKNIKEENEISPVDIIDEWVEEYLDANGLGKSERQYNHDAGTSLTNVLRKHGFEIRKIK